MSDYSAEGARPVNDAGAGQPPDPIEEEAAEIDPRSPEAPEQIEQLREDAEALGRDVQQPPV